MSLVYNDRSDTFTDSSLGLCIKTPSSHSLYSNNSTVKKVTKRNTSMSVLKHMCMIDHLNNVCIRKKNLEADLIIDDGLRKLDYKRKMEHSEAIQKIRHLIHCLSSK